MGYYSKFKLECKTNREKIQARLIEISEESEDVFDGESTKWYDFKEHLSTVSKEFPKTIITIEREGEETGDLERIHALNGKITSEEPEITWKSKAQILEELKGD